MTIDQDAIKGAVSAFGDHAAQLVELTLKDADNFVVDIQNGINDNNPEDVKLAAHSLKSIMKQIEAHNVSDIAFKMEQAGESGDITSCTTLKDDLAQEYEATKNFLNSIV